MLKWIWLAEKFGTGCVKTDELIDFFGSAEDVYEASENDLRHLKYITKRDIDALMNKSLDTAESIVRHCDEKGYRIITLNQNNFPGRVRDIPSRPLVLFVNGELPDVDYYPSFSIVGTRHCTPYGAKVASVMAMGVAQAGGIVTSGMAVGIDSFAHKGALKGNGKTIAVLGSGLDVCYPKQNEPLLRIIKNNGCVLSEFMPKVKPAKYTFPVRNRIISALSEATVVVEAGIKSGSLITASYAAEQGRLIYAVPGNIDSAESAGPNRLIIDGARPLVTVRQLIGESVPVYPHVLKLSALENTSLLSVAKSTEKELLEELKPSQVRARIEDKQSRREIQQPLTGMDVKPQAVTAPSDLNDLQMHIFTLISEQSLTLNEIAMKCEEPVYRVMAELTALELKKVIELLPTGRFVINV